MNKILTILLLMAIALPGFSNDRKSIMSTAYEDGTFKPSGKIVFGNQFDGIYPNGVVVPGTDSYFDYVTNGKNVSNMWVSGDTMIISYFGADQSDPTGATSRVAYYVVSTDKGQTWGTPLALTTLPRRSAYPDLVPYIGSLGRSIGLSGRLYTPPGPGATGGGAFTDAFFGLGSFTSVQTPNTNRDYFSDHIGGSFMGGIAAIAGGTPASDTLNFWKFDMETNSFTMVTPVVLPNQGIEANSRWHFVSNGNNDMIAVWWDSPAGSEALRLSRSSDGGATWSTNIALQQSFSTNGVINGDTCSPWFGIDAVYKPGTTEYAVAWNTLYPTGSGQSSGDPQGCKILFWNPNVNGGVPVEVAGRSNMNTIADTNLLFPVLTLTGGLQVGVTPVSHPSIGYNTDGALMCVFSGYQPLPDTLDGFAMNDIYYSLSYDDGATWSTPVNLTNTSDWDELYPTVAPNGNTNEFFIHYQATRGPGSQSFTDNAPTYVVHQVAQIIPTSSIQNISNEVPDGFSLKQNFPNPFNPSTSIQFNLPTSSLVTLKVYDVTGKEVATLVNSQRLAAGSFQYDFNASNLSSGMYFYTLSTDNFRETKKMMLIK